MKANLEIFFPSIPSEGLKLQRKIEGYSQDCPENSASSASKTNLWPRAGTAELGQPFPKSIPLQLSTIISQSLFLLSLYALVGSSTLFPLPLFLACSTLLSSTSPPENSRLLYYPRKCPDQTYLEFFSTTMFSSTFSEKPFKTIKVIKKVLLAIFCSWHFSTDRCSLTKAPKQARTSATSLQSSSLSRSNL